MAQVANVGVGSVMVGFGRLKASHPGITEGVTVGVSIVVSAVDGGVSVGSGSGSGSAVPGGGAGGAGGGGGGGGWMMVGNGPIVGMVMPGGLMMGSGPMVGIVKPGGGGGGGGEGSGDGSPVPTTGGGNRTLSDDCEVVQKVDSEDESGGWIDTEAVSGIADEGNGGEINEVLLVDEVEVDAEGLGNVTVPTEVAPAVLVVLRVLALGVLEPTTVSAVLLVLLLKIVGAGVADDGEGSSVVEPAEIVVTVEEVAGLLGAAGVDGTPVSAVEVSADEAEPDTKVDKV